MENKFKRFMRSPNIALDWLDFTDFDSLIESLKNNGFLNNYQIAALFQIALKEEPNISEDIFLIINNLSYLVEELQDALGDEALEDFTKINFEKFIESCLNP